MTPFAECPLCHAARRQLEHEAKYQRLEVHRALRAAPCITCRADTHWLTGDRLPERVTPGAVA